MSTGRTFWWAKDAGWWRREIVVALGEEFGPAGPAVLDWLSCEAKVQNAGGVVKTGLRTLSRGTFVELVTVGHVLSRAVALGGLHDLEQGELTFTCRISGWRSDQDRGAAAARKADQRARAKEETPPDAEDPEPGHDGTDRDMSRPVTPCPKMSPTGQDRTEEETAPLPPQGGDGFPGPRPDGKRQRQLDAWKRQVQAYADEHFPGLPQADRLLDQAISNGATDRDSIAEFILTWHGGTSPGDLEVQRAVAA